MKSMKFFGFHNCLVSSEYRVLAQHRNLFTDFGKEKANIVLKLESKSLTSIESLRN